MALLRLHDAFEKKRSLTACWHKQSWEGSHLDTPTSGVRVVYHSGGCSGRGRGGGCWSGAHHFSTPGGQLTAPSGEEEAGGGWTASALASSLLLAAWACARMGKVSLVVKPRVVERVAPMAKDRMMGARRVPGGELGGGEAGKLNCTIRRRKIWGRSQLELNISGLTIIGGASTSAAAGAQPTAIAAAAVLLNPILQAPEPPHQPGDGEVGAGNFAVLWMTLREASD